MEMPESNNIKYHHIRMLYKKAFSHITFNKDVILIHFVHYTQRLLIGIRTPVH